MVLATTVSNLAIGATLYFVDKHTGNQLQGALSHPGYAQVTNIVAYSPENEPLDTGRCEVDGRLCNVSQT